MGKFNSLQTATIREFSGGLNVVTDDLNMSTEYSTIETNVYNNINGTKSVRYGTKLFLDIASKNQEKNYTIANTLATHYAITMYQPSTIKVAKGAKIYIYDDINGTNLLAEGTVYLANDTRFEFFISTNTILTINTDYYADIYLTDSINPKVKLRYSGTSSQQYTKITKTQIPELADMSIGSIFDWSNTSETQTGKVEIIDIDEDNYYCYPKTNSINFPSSGNNIKYTINPYNIAGTMIINGTYFIDKLILVTDRGEVLAVDGEGDIQILFNDTIDKALNYDANRSNYGWHDTTSVCFTVFNGILTVWNGIDRPLAVDLTNKKYPCNYLIDNGTLTNDFVPRAKYAIAFNHYLIAGNIYDENEGRYITDRLCISAKDCIGTFYTGLSQDLGNDAVNVDLGTIISANGQNIKGLSRYRNQLVIGFDDVSVFGTLGDYVETEEEINGVTTTIQNHKPKLDDVINNHGCISNRTYNTISSELICLDYSGLPNFRRMNLSNLVVPKRISDKIAPELYQSFINLPENVIEDKIFGIDNPKENQYLLFIPKTLSYQVKGKPSSTWLYFYTKTANVPSAEVARSSLTLYTDPECKNVYTTVQQYNVKYTGITHQLDSVCYAYTLHTAQSNVADGAWSKFIGWNFDYGITSALNTVFLGKGLKIYTLGSIDNPYYADYIGDSDYPAINGEDTAGKAIEFEWELPWADFGDRAAIKKSRYLALSTTGLANFTVDMFVDYIYTNRETGELIPSLSMNFVAGDAYGYGNGNNYTINNNNIIPNVQGNQYYGGGRRTNTEYLFAWTTKYKIAKFRISGSSKFKLNINSLTVYYLKGNIRR